MRRLMVVVVVACGLHGVAACRPSPRRVTSEDGRCSVVMPGAPKHEQSTQLLGGGVGLKVESWGVGLDDVSTVLRPTDTTFYVLRRAVAPSGMALSGARLLDEASRQFGQKLPEGYSPPAFRPVTTSAGPAVEVRSSLSGAFESLVASRYYAVSDGYCEVAVFGARTEHDVSAFFNSAVIRR